jgi:hypothetical protein
MQVRPPRRTHRALLIHVAEAPLDLDAVSRHMHCEEGILGDRALEAMVKAKVHLDGVLADDERAVHADERVAERAVLQRKLAKVVACVRPRTYQTRVLS